MIECLFIFLYGIVVKKQILLTKFCSRVILLRHNDELCHQLNISSQFGSASRGSEGSSVKIRHNHHYRN